jgi:hypothetical protein
MAIPEKLGVFLDKIQKWAQLARKALTVYSVGAAIVSATGIGALIIWTPAWLLNPTLHTWAAAIFGIGLIGTTIALIVVVKEYRRYREIAGIFGDLADNYADCDKSLFDKLFLDVHNATANVPPEMNLAVLACEMNIREIVNSTAKIFGVHTGADCAVSLKIPVKDLQTGQWMIKGKERDKWSRKKRPSTYDNPHPLEDNTAFKHIAIDRIADYFVCDNLRALQDSGAGRYVNKRANWRSDYNATLVYGIGDRKTHPAKELVAYLCVDNMSGGLDNKQSHKFMEELRARLEVMLYRGIALEAIATAQKTKTT